MDWGVIEAAGRVLLRTAFPKLDWLAEHPVAQLVSFSAADFVRGRGSQTQPESRVSTFPPSLSKAY